MTYAYRAIIGSAAVAAYVDFSGDLAGLIAARAFVAPYCAAGVSVRIIFHKAP